MLSPCRTSKSSFRSLIAAAKVQNIPVTQARPSHDSTSSPSCSASTSRSCLSNSSRNYHSSVKHLDGERARPLQSEKPSPAVNIPLTPKAAQTVDEAQAWLCEEFPELPLPDDIAMMMITHESWNHGAHFGHNRRLSFIGRRAMKFYISLFLSKHTLNGAMLSSTKVNELLHTSKLGDDVGRSLKLAEVMRWTPAISDGQSGPKEMGLYKIRGVTVEALVGAIYHQHGAQAARAFFSSKILPNLGTFSAREAEDLKSAIESEAKGGHDLIRNLGSRDTSMGTEQITDVKVELKSATRRDSPVESSENVTGPTTTSILTGARRRTIPSKSDLPIEEESKSVRPASERQSIA